MLVWRVALCVPANPSSPPVDVKWGEQTTDEMCIAFVRVTVDRERLGHQPTYAGVAAR